MLYIMHKTFHGQNEKALTELFYFSTEWLLWLRKPYVPLDVKKYQEVFQILFVV